MVFVKLATFGAICRTIKTLLWYHQDLKVRTRIIEGLSRPYFCWAVTGQVTMARVENKW